LVDSSVVVRDLRKVYEPSPPWMRFLVRSNLTHDVVALDGIDFEVGPGEIMAVVGPNGAGKSTAFRVLVGLTSPTSGTASVMGFNCASQSKQVRRMVGWMPAEDRSLLLRLSCRENLRFHARLHNISFRDLNQSISAVLADVGLTEFADDTPFALSAGMRARLQLARALLHHPRVLILDEPTGSVDPVAAHTLLELITEIVAERRIAALISSHRLEEIEALHSHVILLDRGAVRYDGDLDELRKEWDLARVELGFTNGEVASSVASMLKASNHLETVTQAGDSVTVTLKPTSRIADVLTALGSDVAELLHIRDLRTPLRDILASMYGSRTDP
jgi:ABC-2 type transport system ATP-binding protein